MSEPGAPVISLVEQLPATAAAAEVEEVLEGMLAMARQDEMVAVAIVGLHRDGGMSVSQVFFESAHARIMIGSLEVLKDDLLRGLRDCRDEVTPKGTA